MLTGISAPFAVPEFPLPDSFSGGGMPDNNAHFIQRELDSLHHVNVIGSRVFYSTISS